MSTRRPGLTSPAALERRQRVTGGGLVGEGAHEPAEGRGQAVGHRDDGAEVDHAEPTVRGDPEVPGVRVRVQPARARGRQQREALIQARRPDAARPRSHRRPPRADDPVATRSRGPRPQPPRRRGRRNRWTQRMPPRPRAAPAPRAGSRAPPRHAAATRPRRVRRADPEGRLRRAAGIPTERGGRRAGHPSRMGTAPSRPPAGRRTRSPGAPGRETPQPRRCGSISTSESHHRAPRPRRRDRLHLRPVQRWVGLLQRGQGFGPGAVGVRWEQGVDR